MSQFNFFKALVIFSCNVEFFRYDFYTSLDVLWPKIKTKALITLCVSRVPLGQKTQHSLRWVHLKVI